MEKLSESGKAPRRLEIREKLRIETALVKKESMNVLKEFEAMAAHPVVKGQ